MQLLQDYNVLFGEEPPTQYWPRPQKESAEESVFHNTPALCSDDRLEHFIYPPSAGRYARAATKNITIALAAIFIILSIAYPS